MLGRKAQLQQSLTKTRRSFFGRIADLFRDDDLSDETWDELEMLLIQADVGVQTTTTLIAKLRAEADAGQLRGAQQAQARLKEELVLLLRQHERAYLSGRRMLNVVMVVGVNGSGKTTSIGKLAQLPQAAWREGAAGRRRHVPRRRHRPAAGVGRARRGRGDRPPAGRRPGRGGL